MPRNELLGWLLFTASSVAFLVVGLQDEDPATIVGSVLFLGGCLAFLVPLGRDRD